MSDPAAGASDDWAYDSLGVKYSFTIEMRPAENDSNFGFGEEFILDQKEIKPAVEEVFAGIEVVLNEIAKQSPNDASKDAPKDAPAMESHNDSQSNQYLSSIIAIIVILNIGAVLKLIF